MVVLFVEIEKAGISDGFIYNALQNVSFQELENLNHINIGREENKYMLTAIVRRKGKYNTK